MSNYGSPSYRTMLGRGRRDLAAQRHAGDESYAYECPRDGGTLVPDDGCWYCQDCGHLIEDLSEARRVV